MPFVDNKNETDDNINISLSDSDIQILALLQNGKAPSIIANISDEHIDKLRSQIEELKLLQNEENSEYWLQEAVLLSSLGNYQEAIDVLDKVQELFPYNYSSYINKAVNLQRMGLYRDAGGEYLKAIKIDSKHPVAYLSLADLFIKYSDNKKTAKNIYENGLNKTGDHIDLLKAYADYFYTIEGDLENSIKYWEQALYKTELDSSKRAIKEEIESLQAKLNR